MNHALVLSMLVSVTFATPVRAIGFAPWTAAAPGIETAVPSGPVPAVGFAPWRSVFQARDAHDAVAPRLGFHGFGPWIRTDV